MSPFPQHLDPQKHALYAHACQIMGWPGAAHIDPGRRWIVDYSWPEADVRRVLGELDDFRWFTRVLELEYRQQAIPCFSAAPGGPTADGAWEERAGWRDQPLENWADIEIMSAGVVALAALYGQ
jgi:hypothetical protein